MRPRHRRDVLLVAAALLVVGACSHSGRTGESSSPEVVLHPEGAPEVRVAVEVARSSPERERGLMYRDHLGSGSGMLFLFERQEPQTFWMRNTYIPLDMIFIGADRRVVGVVEKAEPLTDNPRAVEGSSQFVLEVPGGWAAPHHIAPGTRVEFLHVD